MSRTPVVSGLSSREADPHFSEITSSLNLNCTQQDLLLWLDIRYLAHQLSNTALYPALRLSSSYDYRRMNKLLNRRPGLNIPRGNDVRCSPQSLEFYLKNEKCWRCALSSAVFPIERRSRLHWSNATEGMIN